MKLLGASEPCEYIVQFIRAWQEDSYFYLQIEHVDRGTLKDLILDLVMGNELVNTQTIWHIVHDVTAGLRHIHECGMVHLDIKPANLLISDTGLIKIGDFGMAAQNGSKEDGHEGDSRYLAMELMNNSAQMPSADIFSLGITLYEAAYDAEQLLCGYIALPSEGDFWQALRQGTELVKKRPPALIQLIQQMMSPDPDLRPSANDVLKMVEVKAVVGRADPILLSAKSVTKPNSLCRSESFQPICSPNGLSIDASEEYMLSLMERALTPH
jgi:membrane-associated tyrosine/threonine-specific cdc2-inhibitory kinase